MDSKELKAVALNCATTLHCSPVANASGGATAKPADVLDTAKMLSSWLES